MYVVIFLFFCRVLFDFETGFHLFKGLSISTMVVKRLVQLTQRNSFNQRPVVLGNVSKSQSQNQTEHTFIV